MLSAVRQVSNAMPAYQGAAFPYMRAFPLSQFLSKSSSTLQEPPQGQAPQNPGRGPPAPPPQEAKNLRSNIESATFLGTKKRMPEFNLTDRVVLVSGAARGLGLTQAEALLEAGATVYALDRLQEPSPDFYRVQKRAAEELGTTFHYRRIDVRDVEGLNKTVGDIGETHGRMDGLIAAAGIQQETTALDYTAKDANMMFEVNITGVFMTAQAVAKQMICYGSRGSIALIASMSGTIANRVSPFLFSEHAELGLTLSGSHLPRLQRLQSRRPPTSPQSCFRMGPTLWHQSQHHIAGLHRHSHGGTAIPTVPRTKEGVAGTEHAGKVEQAGGVQRGGGVLDVRCKLFHDWGRLEDGCGARQLVRR